MTHFKGWLQAVAGGVVMCAIMLGLVALACAAVAVTAVWLVGP